MEKLSKWKQSNPKDQMTSILMAIEGWTFIIKSEIGDKEKATKMINEHIEELKIIKDNYVSTEW